MNRPSNDGSPGACRLLVDIAIKALSPAINDPTTAVQTIDQLEDLLRRLGAAELDAGYVADESSALRLVFPTPTWEDYLTLAFDEIRQFGSGSVQVMRRLRAALDGLADWLPTEDRRQAVRRYLAHLDRTVETSSFDAIENWPARVYEIGRAAFSGSPTSLNRIQFRRESAKSG